MHDPARRWILSAVLAVLVGAGPVAGFAGDATSGAGPEVARTLSVAIGGRRVQLSADEALAATLSVPFEPGTNRLNGAGQRALRRFAADRDDLFSGGRTLLVAVQVPAGRPDLIAQAIQRAQVIRDRLVLTLRVAREDAVVAAVLVGAGAGTDDEPRVFVAPVDPADASAGAEEARRRLRTLALDSMFAARAVAQWEALPAPAAGAAPDTGAVADAMPPMPRPAIPVDPAARPVPLEHFGPAAAPRAPSPQAAPSRPEPAPARPRPEPARETPRTGAPAAPSRIAVRAPVRPPVADPVPDVPARTATVAPLTPGGCARPKRVIDDFYPGGPIVPCPVP